MIGGCTLRIGLPVVLKIENWTRWFLCFCASVPSRARVCVVVLDLVAAAGPQVMAVAGGSARVQRIKNAGVGHWRARSAGRLVLTIKLSCDMEKARESILGRTSRPRRDEPASRYGMTRAWRRHLVPDASPKAAWLSRLSLRVHYVGRILRPSIISSSTFFTAFVAWPWWIRCMLLEQNGRSRRHRAEVVCYGAGGAVIALPGRSPRLVHAPRYSQTRWPALEVGESVGRWRRKGDVAPRLPSRNRMGGWVVRSRSSCR